MKADIHPKYVSTTVRCSCGNTFTTRSTKDRPARRALQRVPSLLHRQAEAGRHRRPHRALRAPLRQAQGRQEVAPSSRRGPRRARPHQREALYVTKFERPRRPRPARAGCRGGAGAGDRRHGLGPRRGSRRPRARAARSPGPIERGALRLSVIVPSDAAGVARPARRRSSAIRRRCGSRTDATSSPQCPRGCRRRRQFPKRSRTSSTCSSTLAPNGRRARSAHGRGRGPRGARAVVDPDTGELRLEVGVGNHDREATALVTATCRPCRARVGGRPSPLASRGRARLRTR